MENVDPSVAEQLYDSGYTLKEVSDQLQAQFNCGGFSVTSLKRYNQRHGLRVKPSTEKIDVAVADAISVLGEQSGRR